MKPVLIVLFVLMLAACSKGGEKTYQFYDSHVYNSFIIRLDKSGASYKPVGNMTISYSSSQHDRVMAVVDAVMADYYSDCSGSFQDARRQNALKSRLRKKRIPYRVVKMDDGEKLLCDPGYTEDFNSVYRSVLRRYR